MKVHQHFSFFYRIDNKIKFLLQGSKNLPNNDDIFYSVTMDLYLVDDCHRFWEIVYNRLSWFHLKHLKLRRKCLKLLPLSSCYTLVFLLHKIPNMLSGVLAKNSFQDWEINYLEEIILLFSNLNPSSSIFYPSINATPATVLLCQK